MQWYNSLSIKSIVSNMMPTRRMMTMLGRVYEARLAAYKKEFVERNTAAQKEPSSSSSSTSRLVLSGLKTVQTLGLDIIRTGSNSSTTTLESLLNYQSNASVSKHNNAYSSLNDGREKNSAEDSAASQILDIYLSA